MKIADIISDSMEPAEPQTAILEFFKANEGKRLDKRFIDKLNAALGRTDLRLRHVAGMTDIEWGEYGSGKQTYSVPSGSLLVAYDSEGNQASAERLLKHNPAYFSAREIRNRAREQALADPKSIEALEETIEQFKALRAKLHLAFVYGSVFSHDENRIRRAYDIENTK